MLSFLFWTNFILSTKSQPETTLEKIKNKGFIAVGIREDAVPFGYRDFNNNWSGICFDLMELIRQKLRQQLDLQVLTIKIYKSTLYNRFDLVRDQFIDLECGPNTIRDDVENITFSQPFFFTGTQILIRSEAQKKFQENSSLSDLTLGVLRNTTTEQLLTEKYPQVTLQQFQGVNGRLRGVQAVQKEVIDGFASDGILLIGEATLQGLIIPQDYLLVPAHPLDCVIYGLVLPKDDPQWRDFINSVISQAELRPILRKWFTVVSPYIQETADFCISQRN